MTTAMTSVIGTSYFGAVVLNNLFSELVGGHSSLENFQLTLLNGLLSAELGQLTEIREEVPEQHRRNLAIHSRTGDNSIAVRAFATTGLG
jgi:hypothetical protein